MMSPSFLWAAALTPGSCSPTQSFSVTQRPAQRGMETSHGTEMKLYRGCSRLKWRIDRGMCDHIQHRREDVNLQRVPKDAGANNANVSPANLNTIVKQSSTTAVFLFDYRSNVPLMGLS